MTAETSGGETHATIAADTAVDTGSQSAGETDTMSFHALAIAADPALAGTAAQADAAGDGNLAWQGDTGAYDGHVALALDPDPLPDIDSMLDLLTVSHDLFDVPAMDVGGALDDSSAA